MKSILETVALYKALSAEDGAIIKSQNCSGEMTPTQWLSFVDRLGAFDIRAENARRWARLRFWLSLVTAIATAIIGAKLGNTWVLVLAVIAGLAAFAVFLPLWLWLRSVDVADSLRTYIAPLIAILREDTKPAEKLKCTIDLTRCDAAAKRVKTIEVPKDKLPSRTTRRTDTYYRNAWFSIEGTLIDGSKLKFQITDFGTVAEIRKRGTSGKIKTKTKTKMKRVSRLTVRPGSGSTVIPPPQPSAMHVITRPDGSTAIRSQRIESLPRGSSLNTPVPELDTFTALTGQALQGITRSAAN